MAVVDVKRGWSNEAGEAESQDGIKGTQGSDHVYTVLVDNVNDDEETVLAGTGVPRIRDLHPTNFAKRVMEVRAEKVSPTFWRVTVRYGSPTRQGVDNPLAQPAKYMFSEVTTTEQVDEDINGYPIITPNGERYDPQEIDWMDMGMEVSKNLEDWNAYTQLAFFNTTNIDTIGAFPPGVMKLTGFRANTEEAEDYVYWSVSATFHIRLPRNPAIDPSRAWWKRIRCEGLYERVLMVDELYHIVRATDEENQPVSQPVLLYARGENAGQRIPVAEPSDEPPSLQYAEWQEYQIFRSVPYAPLGIFF